MDPPTKRTAAPLTALEAVTRCLRHEVGDLLQTVYAAVAILKERLPAGGTPERTVLTNLRSRAERTRELLDTIHDLVSPLSLAPTTVNLSELATTLAAATAARYPQIEIRTTLAPVPSIHADPTRLTQLGSLVLGY